MLKESVSYVTQTSFFIISSKFLTILSVYFEMETETSVATIKLMNQYLVKLDSFYGTNFTRWKYKFKFLLTALKIFYVLDPELAPIPEPTDEDIDERRVERKKRQEDELIFSLTYPQRPLRSSLRSLHVHLIGKGDLGRSRVQIKGR